MSAAPRPAFEAGTRMRPSEDARSHELGFRAAVCAEAMKGRRGAARKTALLAPLPLCLLGTAASGLVTGGLGPGAAGFDTYGWCYWYTLLLPVAIALMTAGVAGIDARSKLRGIMGAPTRPGAVWYAKVVYALALAAAASLAMALCSTIVHLCGGSAAGPAASLAIVTILTAASSWMVPAGLFLTMRFGMLAGIALPLLVQLACGIAFYGSGLWWLCPPAAAMRLCSPLTGVAPSGVPLAPGEAFGVIDPAWGAALCIAVACGIAAAAIGNRWFRNQEAR